MGDSIMKVVGRLLIVLLFIIFLYPSYAATDDFQYIAPSEISSCDCSNFFSEGEVTNTGDVTTSYLLRIESKELDEIGTSWVQIVPEYFSLKPGESKKVKVFYNIPCKKEGNFKISTKINSALGLEKVHASTLNVHRCEIIQLQPIKTQNAVCKGNVAVYEFEVGNKGLLLFEERVKPYIESVELDKGDKSIDIEDYYQFNKPYYTLKTSESSNEKIYLYINSLDLEGEYDFNVVFNATISDYVYKIPIHYKAVDCYAPVPVESKEKSISSDYLITILILLLLLLFLILLVSAVQRRRKAQGLKRWVDAEEEKPKKEKKKAEKKVEKRVVKKKAARSKEDEKLAKGLLFGLSLLLLLVLLFSLGWLLFIFWPFLLPYYLAFVILGLLLLLIALLILSLNKKRRQKGLYQWIAKEDADRERERAEKAEQKRLLEEQRKAEKEAERKRKIEEKKKAEEEERKRKIEAKRKAEKEQREREKKKAKKLTKRERENLLEKRKRIGKIALIIAIILIILLLLLGIGWLFYQYWPQIAAWSAGAANETNATAGNISGDIITEPEINLSITDELNLTEATPTIRNINLLNPVISMFSDYGSMCSIFISVFIVLFILSLFLFTIKAKRWKKWQKKTVKYLKYALPILFFVCLVFTFVFCVFNNTSSDSLRCVEIRFEKATGIEDVMLNASVNMSELEDSASSVTQKPAIGCFCYTLFGELPLLWCWIILIIILLLILLIAWLLANKEWLVERYEESKARRDEERARARKEREKLKREKEKLNEKEKLLAEEEKQMAIAAQAKAEKKIEKKEVRKEKKEKASNIWKDILILLILLLLLILLAVFFYYYNPFTPLINASNMTNVTNITNITGIEEGIEEEEEIAEELEEVIEPEEEVEDPPEPQLYTVDSDLACKVDSEYLEKDGVIVVLDNGEKFTLNKSLYKLSYSWYLNRQDTGYHKVFENMASNRVIAQQTDIDDLWICEVTLTQEEYSIPINSTPYLVIPKELEGQDPVVEPEEAEEEPEESVEPEEQYNETTEINKTEVLLNDINSLIEYIEENNLTESFQYFVLESGTSRDIDLTDYFVDPDNDTLIFSVKEKSTDNLSIDIWKGVATIRANEGFIGIEDVTFGAEDPAGDSVEGDMTVIVKPREERGNYFLEFLSEYKWYILIGFLVLIILIALLAIYDYTQDRKEKEAVKDMRGEKKQEKQVEKTRSKQAKESKSGQNKGKGGFFKSFVF